MGPKPNRTPICCATTCTFAQLVPRKQHWSAKYPNVLVAHVTRTRPTTSSRWNKSSDGQLDLSCSSTSVISLVSWKDSSNTSWSRDNWRPVWLYSTKPQLAISHPTTTMHGPHHKDDHASDMPMLSFPRTHSHKFFFFPCTVKLGTPCNRTCSKWR